MGQVYVILLENRIGHVRGTVTGIHVDQTHKTRAKHATQRNADGWGVEFFKLESNKVLKVTQVVYLFFFFLQNSITNGKRWGYSSNGAEFNHVEIC